MCLFERVTEIQSKKKKKTTEKLDTLEIVRKKKFFSKLYTDWVRVLLSWLKLIVFRHISLKHRGMQFYGIEWKSMEKPRN